MKPLLYAEALAERRLTAAPLLDDSSAQIATASGLYIPQNYDRQFKGPVSVRTALAASLKQNGDYYGYSLALGSAEVSLLALTNGYRTLANGGRFGETQLLATPPPSLPSADGAMRNPQAVVARSAFIVGDILSDAKRWRCAVEPPCARDCTACALIKAMSSVDLLIDAECDNAPAPSPTPATSRSSRLLLGLSVVLIAFNLRPVFASLSVVLPEIIVATGMSSTAASLLTTLPVVCLGLFAPLAPSLGRRFGTERTLLGCMVLIFIGTLLRGTGNVGLLFAASAIAAAGIAVSNVLLSGLVKRDFAQQAALMMGLYTMAVCGGAAAAAGFTVPLEHAMGGGWTWALAMWAVPAGIVTLLWAAQAWSLAPVTSEAAYTVQGLWRDRLAWQVTFFMGLQSALAYIVMSWLAPILRERGLGDAAAGYVLSVSIITQVVTCLVVPTIAVKFRNQVGVAVVLAVLIVVAMLGCLLAPLSGIWAWAVLLGIAQGGSFALALTLIVLRSPDAHVAAHLSGMAQGVGYLIAALGPLLVGLLHGWTGGFSAAAWLFVGLGVALVVAGLGAGRSLHVGAVTVPLAVAVARGSR